MILYDLSVIYPSIPSSPRDVFQVFKTNALANAMHSTKLINDEIINLGFSNPGDNLQKLILICLWGNQPDLSLNFKSLGDRGGKTIIVDDSLKVIPILLSCKGQITIVLDNTSFELYSAFA